MVRVFVAVDLPGAVRKELARSQELLSRSCARINLVKPSDAHITLKFIGEVEPKVVAKLSDSLGLVSAAPFSARVAGVAGNELRRPRVVWVSVDDGGGCAQLHGMIEGVLLQHGIARDRRAYTPHITLARVKHYDPSLGEEIARLAGDEFGTFTVDRFCLKRSTLTPEGPIYETISEVRL